MKKIFLFIFVLLFIPSLVACDKRPVVKILAPGDYMSDALKESFAEKHGVRVKVDEFSSNEEALTFVKSGKVYDLIMPSDYALEQLIVENQGYIEKIDWTKITTFNRETDLSDGLDDILSKLKTDSGLDLLEYGAPYFWGSVGLIYNADKVSAEDVSQGWELLRMGDKYKVAFYDSSRDALMAGLVSLGYSMNSNSAEEVKAAEDWIKVGTQKGVGYITDNIFEDIPNKTYDIAMAYTGDAAEIIDRVHIENVDLNLDFIIPESGSNIWVDFLVIHTKGNQEYAYQFLNHLLSYEGALDNTEDVFYISPREDVRLEQIKRANTPKTSELFHVVFRPGDDIFRFDPVSKRLIDEAWNRIGVNR